MITDHEIEMTLQKVKARLENANERPYKIESILHQFKDLLEHFEDQTSPEDLPGIIKAFFHGR